MRCYVENCPNETQQRCRECGEPVCKEHGTVPFIMYPIPVLAFKSNVVCDRCTYRLQEREQAFREPAGKA